MNHSQSLDSSQTKESGLQLTHSAIGPVGVHTGAPLPPVAAPTDDVPFPSSRNVLKSHTGASARGQHGSPTAGGYKGQFESAEKAGGVSISLHSVSHTPALQ